jgi:hypothetical protein
MVNYREGVNISMGIDCGVPRPLMWGRKTLPSIFFLEKKEKGFEVYYLRLRREGRCKRAKFSEPLS